MAVEQNPFTGPAAAGDDDNPFIGNPTPPQAPPVVAPPPPQSTTSDVVRAVKHAPIGIERQAGEAAQFAGHVSDKLMGLSSLGAWLAQSGQSLTSDAASRENEGNMPSTDQQNGGFIHRNLPAAAEGLTQLGSFAGGGALTGAAVGSVVPGVGTLVGAGVGATLGMLAQLPLFAGSAGEETYEGVKNAQLQAGAPEQEAGDRALGAGTESAAVMGALQYALQKVGLGKVLEPTLERAAGAKAGELVASVLDDGFKKAAVNTATTTGEMAGITGAQYAGTQAINAEGGYGDGPTLAGTADAVAQGGAMGLVTGAMGAGRQSVKTAGVKALLADPAADPQDRANAALGTAAVLQAKNKQLAQDFGVYAARQIARGQPVEVQPDAFYATEANEIRNPSRFLLPAPAQSQAPNLTDTISDIVAAPDLDTALEKTEGAINRGIAGTSDQIDQLNAQLDQTRDYYAQQAAQAQDAMRQEAFNALQQQQGEGTPAAPAAGAPDATAPTAPTATLDPFAQREQQLAAQKDQDFDAAQQQAGDQNQAVADQQQAAVDQANNGAPTPPGITPQGAAPHAEAPTPPTTAVGGPLHAELNRVAAIMANNPDNVRTTQLEALAKLHPDDAVRQQAAQLAQTRKNRSAVQAEPDVNGAGPQPTTLDANGNMTQGEAPPEFSTQRPAGEQPAAPAPAGAQEAPKAAEPAAEAQPAPAPRTLEQTAPELQPLKAALDKEAQASGQAAGPSIVPVDPATLPDKPTPANNGIAGATTLSKKSYSVVQKLAQLFGQKIQLFRHENPTDGNAHDGVTLSGDGKTIYLNADASSASHLAIVGHELAHQMKKNAPDLYNTLARALARQFTPENGRNFYRYYNNVPEGPGDHFTLKDGEVKGSGRSDASIDRAMTDPTTHDQMMGEWIADLVGNRAGESRTWTKMFRELGGNDNANKGLIYRIADFITSYIDHLMQHVPFRKFATDDMVKDLASVRENVRQALKEYAQRSNSRPMQHEADMLRARQENKRAGTEPKLVEPVKNDRAEVGREPSRAAPAPVADRPLSTQQGSREVESIKPPEDRSKPTPIRPRDDDAERSQDSGKPDAPEPSGGEGAEDIFARAQRESEERNALADKLVEGKGPEDSVLFQHPDGKRTAIAGPDASRAGGYRITRLDENGPYSHGERPTLRDAVKDALHEGYEPVETPAAETRASAPTTRAQIDPAEIRASLDAQRAQGAARGARLNAARARIDPTQHSLMQAIAKLGGIDPAEVSSQWGYSGREGNLVTGFGGTARRGGRSIAEMTEALHQRGYLQNEDPNELEEKYSDGLRGVDHHHLGEGQEAEFERQRDASLTRDEEDAQQGYNELPEQDRNIADKVDEDEPFTTEEEDAIAAAETGHLDDSDIPWDANDSRWSTAEPDWASGPDAARGEASAAGEEPAAGSQERATGDDRAAQPRAAGEENFGLRGESRDEAEARLNAEEAARQQRVRDALDEERRMRADEEAKVFKLTGSDRPADANPDQDALFSRIRAPQAVRNAAAKLEAKAQQRAEEKALNGSYLGPLNARQAAAVKRVGGLKPKQTLGQQMHDLKADLGKKLIQGIADQFYPIKELDKGAYMLTRLSKGYTGTFEAALLYGRPFLRDGVPDVNVKDGGYVERVLVPLKGEHQRFFWWLAAQRAERLTMEERENLFGTDDISAIKTFNQADPNDPATAGREQRFQKALEEHDKFNKAVLDIVRKSGLVDDEWLQKFADNIYVPFYRVLDDGNGVQGPGGSSGIVNAQGWKKLKGGKNQLNGDLLANVLNNWAHLMGASARNRAAIATMDAAVKAGVAEKFNTQEAAPKGAVRVMRDGKAEYYEIKDRHLLTAVSAMAATVPGYMKPLATFKRIMTTGTTLSPKFRVANMIRDTLSTLATSDIKLNPFANAVQGWKASAHDSQTHASMLASGGIINFGSMLEGNEATRVHKLTMMGVKSGNILDSTSKVDAFWKRMQGAAEAYHEFGNKVENMNRAALYEQLRAKGMNHAEASFHARDVLDFSLQGAAPVVRFLTTAVPFLNARIQGAYKLGRASVEDPKRAGIVMGSVAMASLGLMLANQDDPDWKARPDWDRDNYWWFKVGGEAFRIPKPFEVGAVGTLAERTWEKMIDPEMTNSRYVGELRSVLMNQFNLNPVPQIIKPLWDVYANQDDFRQSPIETPAMQAMQPEDRYTPQTTMAARMFGQLGLPEPTKLIMGNYSKLSPVQIESLVKGYLGWTGMAAMHMADIVARPLSSTGVKPALQTQDYTMGFLEDLPANQSRYLDQFYAQNQASDQAYNSWREALRSGQIGKAQDVMNTDRTFGPSNRTLIQEHGTAGNIAKIEATLSLQAKRVADNPNLTADEKRARLDSLNQQRNNLARTGSLALLRRETASSNQQ